jgi:hypothetical protein
VTDGIRRRERAIEMYAVDACIDRQHLDAVAFRLDHRGIVADADEHPWRRRRQAGADTGDELALRTVGDGCRAGHARPYFA